MKKLIEEQFDVVVIGAGPAGMMAAIRAAQLGARVALVDKKEEPGKKLLMAGNGRCNITQDQDNVVELSNLYKNGRFLLSAFNAFRPGSVQEFFTNNGVPTKVEKNGRVFPASDKAQDVLGVLVNVLKENNITFLYKSHIVDFIMEENNPSEIVASQISRGKISKIKLKKRELFPKNVIIAVGGKSYPATGSMGDGYEWAAKMGHKIIEPMPVLVPIKIKEDWVGELQGVSAGSVSIAVYQGGKKKFSNEGDLMFTHYGFSGPLALNMSRDIAKLVSQSDENIKFILDLKPYLSFEQLDEIILTDFERNADKKLSNCLHDVFSPKLLDFVLRYSGLDLEKHAAKISRKERHILVNLVKNLSVTFDSLFGFEMAMVTSGGVSTREIDSRTMQSKIVPNLYFAGEIIDVDGPTGGYNLQMCWSTGYLAGESAAKNLKA
ncbi:MAG TPA: aminoacetone oxidase family FAD-binding enzyme [Candidatus Moranbacteria bacterium]|nr:aminoacetone oxidase family FAD-binding enzyme [Candidatus Moranbacteria bacterium]HBT46061.1 aminoacetone oxidase family FAD-binding enzyme [Candidatus Moranbacteria bacterium]